MLNISANLLLSKQLEQVVTGCTMRDLYRPVSCIVYHTFRGLKGKVLFENTIYPS